MQPLYQETETQADRQTDERTEKGKGSREEAEAGTGGRWQSMKLLWLSSSPVWKLRQLHSQLPTLYAHHRIAKTTSKALLTAASVSA